MPSSLTEIPDNAFKDCATLTEITFPSDVVRIGDAAFWGCSGISELNLPSHLTSIGSCAFNGLSKLTHVIIPPSIEEIGCCAFTNCPNISTVTMPIGKSTFSSIFTSHKNITSVTLVGGSTDIPDDFLADISTIKELSVPDTITSIGAHAFKGLSLLEEIKLSPCLTNIGAYAFQGLNKLTEVTIPPSVTSIGDMAFADCPNIKSISLPGNVARVTDVFPTAYNQSSGAYYNLSLVSATVTGTSGDLGEGIFAGCFALKFVTIPTCVTNISDSAFYGCTQLEPFALWEGLTIIGDNAFNGVSTLQSIILPNTLQYIGANAFYGIKTVQSLTIPDSVTYIGTGAFGQCSDIRTVTMPAGLCTLDSAFPGVSPEITAVTLTGYGTSIPDGFLRDCAAVASITIPEGVTTIGSYAFSGTSLASIEIPSTVTAIGARAFAGLSLIEELTLPAALQTIGDRAFEGCSRLTSIVIPKGVTELGDSVFNNCSSLSAIYYLTTKAPAVKTGAYGGTVGSLTSYVLKGSTGWDGLATSKALPQSWPGTNSRAIEWWELNTFDVTFMGNGGAPELQTVLETTWTSYVLPSEPPSRTGLTFTGWWTEPINGGEVKASTKVKLALPHTLYAHWRNNTYTIRFDLNGVSGELPALEMEYGTVKALPSCKISRLDYGFAGWSLSPGGTVDFADEASVCNLTTKDAETITLYAVWVPRTWTAADYLNAECLSFATAGDVAWLPDVTTNHDGIASMRCGIIGKEQSSTLKTSVKGSGMLSFWWKVICEPADTETGDLFDYLELTVDGEHPEAVQPIAGDVDWVQVTVRIDGAAAEHEIAWSFVKDNYDAEELADVAWVDEVIWQPDPITISFSADEATSGDVPESIVSAFDEKITLPSMGSLMRDGYRFVGWSDGVLTYEEGATYTVGMEDVSFSAVWREFTFNEILDIPDLVFTTGGDAKWAIDTSISYDGVASLRSGAITLKQESWVETSVPEAGTLSFWWKADGLVYRANPVNYLQIEVDGLVVSNIATTGWAFVSVDIAGTGAHTVRWTYKQTRSQSSGTNCAWLDEVVWTPSASKVPVIEGDSAAVVTGDAEKGYVIVPSEGRTAVEVTIPDGMDAAKVTVEVSPEVETVVPNGAAVRVVRGTSDITKYLDIPAAVDGVIDLSAAKVKDEYVKESLDTTNDAKIDFSAPDKPSLTTAPTREGLVYRLKEGTTLEAMKANTSGDSKVGDGKPWEPTITVKGGSSGFYTIEVSK